MQASDASGGKKLNEDLSNLQDLQAVEPPLEEEQQQQRKPVDVAALDQMSNAKSGRSSKFETKTVLKPKIAATPRNQEHS